MNDAAATCDACHRRMRPSPDGLGPKCRARKHPRTAKPATRPARRMRPGPPYPDQIALFEETEHA